MRAAVSVVELLLILFTAVRVVPEGSWRHFSVSEYKTRRVRYVITTWYFLVEVRMQHEHSALEFAYHFVSNTAVMLCSYSEPPERAAACFVPPAVCSSVCVHSAYPVYCRPLYMSQ